MGVMHRVAFGDLAELPGEVGLLGGGELLVAEEDHVVGVEGLPDLGHHRLAQRPGQVDAVDLRADDGRQGPDVELRWRPSWDLRQCAPRPGSAQPARTRSWHRRGARTP